MYVLIISLNNNICTLNNDTLFCLPLKLHNCTVFSNVLFGNNVFKGLITGLSAAREIKTACFTWFQRSVVFSIQWYSHRAVPDFGASFYTPLEVILASLNRQEMGLLSPIVSWTINPFIFWLSLWNIVVLPSFGLKKFNNWTFLNKFSKLCDLLIFSHIIGVLSTLEVIHVIVAKVFAGVKLIFECFLCVFV